jgi:ring-1,2-phenylacetyl-CoA epoxidase subunit PaaD
VTAATTGTDLAAEIRRAVAEVRDPEIPSVSILDLGMVEEVTVEGGRIEVTLLPTFVGCVALDLIRDAVEDRLAPFGHAIDVHFDRRVAWTTDRITATGREQLRASGFAPPNDETCPYCGSADVATDSLFGPTQCRSLRYCRSCRQPFEAFKPV